MAEAAPGAWRRLAAAEARRVPWRNGRGATLELALWPPQASFAAGDFDWRLARAAVEEDGPFSSFPGFERVLLVLGGPGLRLDHGAAAPAARVAPLEPYRFAGEWPTGARLAGGRVEDLNLLLRRGVVAGGLDVLHGGARVVLAAGPGHALAHVLAGTLRAGAPGGEAQAVAGETLWLRDPSGREMLDADPGATAVLARLVPAGPGA